METHHKYLIAIAVGLISLVLADFFPQLTWVWGWIGGILAISALEYNNN